MFTVAGMCFGLILGWVLGTQQAGPGGAAPVAQTAAAAAPAPAAGTTTQQAPVLDEARVQALTTIVNSDPGNAGARIQLANLYYDAERYPEAIRWYEEALKLDPNNVDASTDLGVAYYYTNQIDKSLAQFQNSLRLDPRHTKTLLNQGVVLAFGKQDLDAAAAAWQKVVDIAPNSQEGQAARRALDAMTSGHAGGAAPATPES